MFATVEILMTLDNDVGVGETLRYAFEKLTTKTFTSSNKEANKVNLYKEKIRNVDSFKEKII